MARRLVVLCVLASTLALGASGCGGSSDDGSSGGGSFASESGAGYFDQVTKIGNQLATDLTSQQAKVSQSSSTADALDGLSQGRRT